MSVMRERYDKITAIRKNEPNISSNEIAERLGESLATVYSTESKAKRAGWGADALAPKPKKCLTPTLVIPAEDLPDERLIALVGNPKTVIKALGL